MSDWLPARVHQVLDEPLEALKGRFSASWAKGAVPFWSEVGGPSRSSSAAAAAVVKGKFDLASYSSVAELEALGLETTKAALVSLGMKCGCVRGQGVCVRTLLGLHTQQGSERYETADCAGLCLPFGLSIPVLCSGSLRDRAERLFSVKGLTPDKFPKKLLAAPIPSAAPSEAPAGAGAAAAGPTAAVPAYAAGIPGATGVALGGGME
jgi:hypothetical protein